MKTLSTTLAALLLCLTCTSAQDSSESKLSALPDKEKIKILAHQIELRDNRIEEMSGTISKLQKKTSKKKSKETSSVDNAQLDQALQDLALMKEEKADIEEKYKALLQQQQSAPQTDPNVTQQVKSLSLELEQTKTNLKTKEAENQQLKQTLQSIKANQNATGAGNINQLQLENELKENQVKISTLQLEKQNLALELDTKKNELQYLQNELQKAQSAKVVRSNNKTTGSKNQNNYDVAEAPKPIKGKNFFYMTASSNLDVENNYGIEIGSIKNFNKRSSSPVKIGLDVAYLSASLINVDLDDLDTVVEQPAGAVGVKLGPNIGIRLVKSIHVNLNYRYFAAGNLTVIDEKTDIAYQGFHKAGASLKVGPVFGRAEWDITNLIEDSASTFEASPLTVYLGLIF